MAPLTEGPLRIPGEDEQDSGVNANADSDGSANDFRDSPEQRSRCRNDFTASVAGHHNDGQDLPP